MADAVFLLQHGRPTNADYLAGYAVELGLKACVAVQVSAETIPDKSILTNFLKHDFKILLGLAGLKTEHKSISDTDPEFATNWAIVCECSPEARYAPWETRSAEYMINAVSDPSSGVLPWIRMHW